MELRFHFGPGYRVYFAREAGRIIVLLTGGDKDSQEKDIRTSIQYLENFRRRNNETL